MNNRNKHLIISGRVQGVGFRYFTYKNARELGIKGWVQNLRDGTVEVVLEGPPENVETMVERLKKGPPSARVRQVEEVESVNSEDFKKFSIRR